MCVLTNNYLMYRDICMLRILNQCLGELLLYVQRHFYAEDSECVPWETTNSCTETFVR